MDERSRFFKSIRYPALFVILLWIVKAVEVKAHLDLLRFGNLPREFSGMIGIVSSPFIHGDGDHLLYNSAPLFILGSLILYFYPSAAKRVILGIYLLTGIGVWLFARQVTHIGASGLVYGFAFFLFFSGVFRNDMKSLAISFFIIFMYGGIVWGLMPGLRGISFETHIFGAISGSLFAYLFRYFDLPPKPQWFMDEDDTQPEINYRYIYVPKDKPAELPPAATEEKTPPPPDENRAEQNP